MHETAQEAQDETIDILNLYAGFCENELAIPVIKGQKTDKEKFAGAEATYTIEAMMHDGKALQSGTTHYFGDGFSKAFDVVFQNRENKPQYPHETSWGISTRLVGAIIMTHGDNNGLVLPPAIAPIQVVVIPVAQHKPGVIEKATELQQRLAQKYRTKIDISDNSPGWKFAEYEMKGVPLRLEIGPRDIEANQCVLVRRDNREKTVVSLDELETRIPELLQTVHDGLYQKALKNLQARTWSASTFEELKTLAAEKSGFYKTMWCGDEACELRVKEEAGLTSRCMPFEQEHIGDVCPICGKPAKTMIIWGRAY